MKIVVSSSPCQCGANAGITTIVEIDDEGQCEITTVCNECEEETVNEVNDAE